MKPKNEPEFVITDRRRFTSEGEVSHDRPAEADEPAPVAQAVVPEVVNTPSSTAVTAPASEAGGAEEKLMEEPAGSYEIPSVEERKAQEDAFNASAGLLDKELASALGGRPGRDMQMTFERFVASIYMSALMQLGLMREEGGAPPPVDLVGARQTIDTMAILSDKTKGNLSPQEENLMQNCLYELRMAYVEVTNALTRAPQPGGPGSRK
ncbi:MAG TPA: DUF1844 domain-containing protein [Terriglobales bacterium]|jgi:hypothetical protein|nr:DUF1844 domain-containing protein [Terriglobales bacterium]